jgi:hypothetical protein
MRIAVRIAFAALVAVAAASWITMAGLEGETMSAQIHEPIGQFNTPLGVKGQTFYVTPDQARADKWAHWGFFCAWAIVFGAGVTRETLRIYWPRKNSN